MPLFTIDMFTVTVAQEYGSGVVEMVVVVVVCKEDNDRAGFCIVVVVLDSVIRSSKYTAYKKYPIINNKIITAKNSIFN